MGIRGRLGLLVDVGTESEIDALCDGWLLPPACIEEADREYALIEHVEWVEESFHQRVEDVEVMTSFHHITDQASGSQTASSELAQYSTR